MHFVALGFGAGLAPRAPGTAGSVVALVPAWLTLDWPLAWRVGALLALALLGVWICGTSARRLGVHDHGGIVFDEIVGMLATVLLGAVGGVFWLALAFVFFRFFDIVKPWPIRDLDHRLKGGAGIMLDDLMAAIYAAGALRIIQAVLPI